MNAAASRNINQNLLLNPLPGAVNISNGLGINLNNLNKELQNNYNQNLEKLILTLTSYIDETTQEYFSILRHQYSHQMTSYSSSNSNQQNNISNFSNKTQYNDFQTSSIYLKQSTSSSSLPQSKSTSPYLFHNIQHQQHQIAANINYIQDLIGKLKQKVINKLNDYLSDIKSIDSSKLNNPENENFKYNIFSFSKENNYQNTNSFDSLVVAFLVLIISDQTNQFRAENDIDETFSQQKTLASFFDLVRI
jgi:hypothetical protein